jgi:hypothetical protein
MVGIDPHKRSHTAVALDEHDAVLDELRVDADALLREPLPPPIELRGRVVPT